MIIKLFPLWHCPVALVISMDSTVVEGADHNPYGVYVGQLGAAKKNYYSSHYRAMGKYEWMEAPEDIMYRTTQSLLNLQKMVQPTIMHLSNDLNVSQIQERVYQKLKMYEEEYNHCQVLARKPSEATYCGEQLIGRLNNEMVAHVKNIIDEY